MSQKGNFYISNHSDPRKTNNHYMLGSLETDKINAATIKVVNFIIGDTSEFNYNADEHFILTRQVQNTKHRLPWKLLSY